MTRHASAPAPSWRLIPSQFPPVGLLDTVATAADAAAAMELAGWTNDRLVGERIARLPPGEWAFGQPNSSVVMASFLHVAPGGMRFNGPDLGAWYAAASLTTAAAEVGHHLRREAWARGAATATRRFRAYSSKQLGQYRDLRGDHLNPAYNSQSYAAGQALGEAARAAGEAGVIYDSLRHSGGTNVATLRPALVTAVVQAGHYEITVEAGARRVEVRVLAP